MTIDKFNLGCRFEKYFIENVSTDLQEMKEMLNGSVHNYIEYAFDFAAAGMYEEASRIMHTYMDGETTIYPMAAYMTGYFAAMSGRYGIGIAMVPEGAKFVSSQMLPQQN